jgi:DNA-binding NarL/FixJ family response regulator
MVRRVSSSIFVGRVAERARLEAALEAAEQGEPGLVLIGGEAGIGKSRLVGELASVANARGALVARGQCLETKAATLPFAPWVEIVRELLLRESNGGEVRPDEAAAAGLARLVPEFGRPERPDARPPSGDDRLRLFHAVLGLVRRTARDRLLLLVIEDLHWADASSLDLLRFVAAELSAEPFLMLATFRSDELHLGHQLAPSLGELVRLPHVARIDLPAFTEAEVADQLTGIGGRRPADDAVERIFARSDGNPFVVEELAGGGLDGELPATLRDILAARLATLSPDTRTVVRAAAAIGREVEHALLAQVAALPEARLLDALREARDHHVLVLAGPPATAGFGFRHALIQEFAYGELLPTERLALHRAIVEALQAANGSPAEVARQAQLAGDLPLALIRSAEAADRAAEGLAFAEALAHAEQALEHWNEVSEPAALTGRDQASLLMLGARCAVALGDWSRGADLGHMALAQLDSERRDDRIAILLDLTYWHYFSDDVAAGAATLSEAAELLPDGPPTALNAYVLTELANLANRRGRVGDARRLAEEALEVSRAIGARAEEVRALVRLAEVLSQSLQPKPASQMLDEAERIAAESLEPAENIIGHLVFRKADVALLAGNFDRAIEIAEAGVALGERVGRLAARARPLRALKIFGLAALGRWGEAEALMNEAGRDPSIVTVRLATQAFVDVLIRRGRIAEAAAAVQATDSGYVAALDGSWILQTRIRVANAEGRWDDARAAADEAIALYQGTGEEDLLFLLEESVRGEADRAEIARDRRRTAEETDARRVGLEHLERLRRIARTAIDLGGAGRLVEAVLVTGEAEGSRLHRHSDAALWDAAARRREALAQPWETAYARFRQAEAILAGRGDRQEALRLLRGAHTIATKLGARPLVERIEGLARRARVRLESMPPRHRARHATTSEGVVVALTAREWEVLSLVAAGHTNREIGEALFISEKTASVHITNAMDKLGALSRYEAAAIATRLGLLDASSGGHEARR